MASSEVTAVLTTVSPKATITPTPKRVTSTPGSISATTRTTRPLSTSTPSPSVSTVNGSATRITSGHTSALTSPITTAAAERRSEVLDVEARQDVR